MYCKQTIANSHQIQLHIIIEQGELHETRIGSVSVGIPPQRGNCAIYLLSAAYGAVDVSTGAAKTRDASSVEYSVAAVSTSVVSPWCKSITFCSSASKLAPP
eukprot:m.118565 g.118565  ORF g.118565 m.118565 type:complete len:102 (+) comp17213_c0_seq2:129-434(+)